MNSSSDLYAGWTESEAAFLALGSWFVVLFIVSLAFFLWLFRMIKKNKGASELAGRVMKAQLRFYGNQFKSGYNQERRKNWGVGLLTLSVPAVTAEEVNQSFSNGLMTIFKGAWDILAPFVGAIFVLWILMQIIQRVSASKSRR